MLTGNTLRGYFKDIINAYTGAYDVASSDEEQKSAYPRRCLGKSARMIRKSNRSLDRRIKTGAILWAQDLQYQNIHPSASAKAIANYTTSLREHFRSFPEIISYSNEFFYKPAQIELSINRIRTKPISEVLRFLKVETKGSSGNK